MDIIIKIYDALEIVTGSSLACKVVPPAGDIILVNPNKQMQTPNNLSRRPRQALVIYHTYTGSWLI